MPSKTPQNERDCEDRELTAIWALLQYRQTSLKIENWTEGSTRDTALQLVYVCLAWQGASGLVPLVNRDSDTGHKACQIIPAAFREALASATPRLEAMGLLDCR